MSNQQGRPTTTGRSHNKRLNTYASKRIVREMIPEKKAKTTSTLVTSFFKLLSPEGQTKVTNTDTTTSCSETACSENLSLSNSSCSKDALFKSETEASQVFTSESNKTQHHCSDSDPESSQSSNMPAILKKNISDMEPEVRL